MIQPDVGKFLEGTEKRDAIHIAILPVVAKYAMNPGDKIKLIEDNYVMRSDQEPMGIVDPFLRETVYPNQKIYMFLYPQTIETLRHVWTHPNVPNETIPFTVEWDTIPTSQPEPINVSPTDSLRNTTEALNTAARNERRRVSRLWLRSFADQLGVGYEELMRHASEYVHNGDYWVDGGRFEGHAIPAEFWTHFSRVYGRVPMESRGNFLS